MATMTSKNARFMPFGIYTLTSLLILGPLLKSGYILTLDLVFTPTLRMPSTITSSYLLHALYRLLNLGVSSQVIEKGVLFSAFLLAGIGTYYLILLLDQTYTFHRTIGAYIAGLLYIVNPFTYDRFMAGQYNVLLGYALLPWYTRTLLQFIYDPTVKSAVALAIWAIITSIVSIHAVGFIVLLTIIALLINVRQRRREKEWLTKVLKYGAFTATIFVIASSYWLFPLVLGKSATATSISGYGTNDVAAFATVGNGWLGKTLHLLQLQGFWAESRALYTLPQAYTPIWSLISIMIVLLVIGGAISYWRTGERKTWWLFITVGIFAGIVALGAMNKWVVSHIPLFAGYREPQKFVALISLAYAVFIARGISAVISYCHRQGGTFLLICATTLVLLLSVVWTPTMWWGFNQQLSSAQYPADWFSVNRRLDSDNDNFQTLFLPWHLYMFFGFAGRIIANPASAYFDKPVIVSDNPEFKNISYSNRTPATKQLDQLLPLANKQETLGRQLAKLNIKYIILENDDDFSNYAYLNRQQDLKLISKSDTLELYINNAWGKQ